MLNKTENTIKYCLYARKSTESEERQILSIDSQTKEMLDLARREGLEVVEIKRESHSAKSNGQRPIFNELLNDINQEKFNGIITWAPDRLSRNAGDLGSLVDLIDQKKLVEIRTHSQSFTNNPNEKFLLMILGSQAKLENDNRGINVKRGIRSRLEMGLWPHMAPLGYLNQRRTDKKAQLIIDPQRAPVIKQIFEKVAYERWSGRQIYSWLKHDVKFKTRGDKPVALSGIYRILNSSFYYGTFESPRYSGKWYQGKHKPIISQELYAKAQGNLRSMESLKKGKVKEFAFTKLLICGLCGSGISACEKFKNLSDGSITKYIYYGCTKSRDKYCKNVYINENSLLLELTKIIDKVEIDKLGMKTKLREEIERFNTFQISILGQQKNKTKSNSVDIRAYAKYLLQNGSVSEKKDLLINLRSELILTNKKLTLVKEAKEIKA